MKTFKLSLLIIGIALMAMTPAYANKVRARTMVDRLIEERRSGRVTPIERIEVEQRRYEGQVERLLRRRSGMSSRELNMDVMREFVSRFEGNNSNIDAIAEILKNITARGNVVPAQQEATANILAQVAKLNESGRFIVEPKDILDVDRAWTVAEKDQLADVLTEARRMVEENPGMKPDKAFETAMKNRNLWEKFRRRCT